MTTMSPDEAFTRAARDPGPYTSISLIGPSEGAAMIERTKFRSGGASELCPDACSRMASVFVVDVSLRA
jgi:hypothetical protein